ncbi:hypothetical protein QCA50_000842 [Cerrena zonata]|uniref:SWR1-complex protein 4 n=1 Tax=Cerrena zonata TaxID=2478898 RepID=A0AAW0GUD2_9APHY
MAASAADVRSILSLPNPSTPGPSQTKPKVPGTTERSRKPEGISRELYSLIGPSAPTLAAQLAKPRLKQKPNLGGGGRVKWEWQSFKNNGRTDSLHLSHWTKAGTDPEAEYTFAKYNVQPTSYVYSQDEYNRFLEDKEWTKEETDYLFELVREYDQRFYVVGDRYDFPGGPPRSLEDLKDRYYSVCRKLVRNRPWAGDESSKMQLISSFQFDKEREVTRKKYVASLEQRTPQQIAEEDALYIELKRLEQTERRFKKERDELLKTLLGVESGLPDISVEDEPPVNGNGLHIDTTTPVTGNTRKTKKRGVNDVDTPTSAGPSSANVISLGQPVQKKAQSAKSAQYDAQHCIHRTDANQTTSNKAAHTPVYFRSYKLPMLKNPTGPRIIQVLSELGISHSRLVMPTRENCARVDGLVEATMSLIDTKKCVDKVEQDIQVATMRLEMANNTGGEGGEGGAGTPSAMDVDEDAEGVEDDDGRAHSVISSRSTKSMRGRKQSQRRSMSISSVDTSATGSMPKRRKR